MTVYNHKVKNWKIEIVTVPKSRTDRAWIEGWVKSGEKKHQFLLTQDGRISWSSESVPQYVKDAVRGYVWEIGERLK